MKVIKGESKYNIADENIFLVCQTKQLLSDSLVSGYQLRDFSVGFITSRNWTVLEPVNRKQSESSYSVISMVSSYVFYNIWGVCFNSTFSLPVWLK